MVIDSTDINRLNLAQQELHQMMESEVTLHMFWRKTSQTFFSKKKTIQQLQNASLLVFANKQDVKGSLGAAKISEALGLSKLKDRQWHIQVRSFFFLKGGKNFILNCFSKQACSALTGEG